MAPDSRRAWIKLAVDPPQTGPASDPSADGRRQSVVDVQRCALRPRTACVPTLACAVVVHILTTAFVSRTHTAYCQRRHRHSGRPPPPLRCVAARRTQKYVTLAVPCDCVLSSVPSLLPSQHIACSSLRSQRWPRLDGQPSASHSYHCGCVQGGRAATLPPRAHHSRNPVHRGSHTPPGRAGSPERPRGTLGRAEASRVMFFGPTGDA